MNVSVLVISPHLDDGVLSCGHLLLTQPHSVVATVMAGNPGPGTLSDWDRECGFVDGDDPVGRRREEDRRALEVVGARPRHLDFLDLPYRQTDGPDGGIDAAQVGARLTDLVGELAPDRVLIPLGLLHPDHVLTHEAGVLLHRSHPALTMWAYMDLPYGLALPSLVSAQLDGLRHDGLCATPVSVESPALVGRKREAVACYASQVAAVTNDLGEEAWRGTFEEGSERFWQLTQA